MSGGNRSDMKPQEDVSILLHDLELNGVSEKIVLPGMGDLSIARYVSIFKPKKTAYEL